MEFYTYKMRQDFSIAYPGKATKYMILINANAVAKL